MRFNPKGVFFWAAAFGIAICFSLGSVKGVIAFLVLLFLIMLLA